MPNGEANGSSGYNPFNLGLKKVNQGERISNLDLNRLSQGVDKTTLRSGPNYLVKRNMGGTTIQIEQQSSGYAPPDPPFTPYGSGDGSKYYVTGKMGTINNEKPKIGDKYIDEVPTPKLEVTEDSLLVAKCNYVEGPFFPQDVSIEIAAGKSMADTFPDTETEGYYLLAVIKKDSKSKDYSTLAVSSGNLIVNRLKAGANTAMWWWDTYK